MGRELLLLLLLQDWGHTAGSELAFVQEPGDVVAVREHPLVLPCQVEGEPPVSISWQRDGLALANDSGATLMPDGSLHLAALPSRRSLPSRAHEYHCVPQNRYGRLVSRRARVQLASLSRFHQHPESVEVEQGGVACFQCLIRGVPEPSISWEHNGTVLSTADHRITLLPGGILHITSVSQADVGTYRCVAHNVANIRHSQDAQLSLTGALGSPRLLQEPEILSGPQNLTLTVHQTAVLECIATGHPQPLVSWSRLDGRSIGVEGIQVLGTGNLMISDVSVQHSGVYVCAANRPGTRVRRMAQGILLVQAPPEFVQWPQSLSKPAGSSAIFTCVAQGVPEPHLIWLKNGKVLSPGDNIQLTHNNSTLMLAGISVEDEAIYQCVAENSAGSNQASAHLAVTGDPEPPPAPRGLRAMALSTSAIRVSWEPPPSNGDIIGYVLHLRPVGEPAGSELQEAVGKSTFEHVFSNLEPATAYSIHLWAYSAEGASQDSASIHASTMGSTPAVLGFSAKVLNATSVQASWELPPQLGPIQGFKLFHRKLPASHFEGPLLLASSVSSFLYTDLEPAALYEIKLQAFNGNGDGNSSVRFVSLRDVPLTTPGEWGPAGCSCSQDESSSLPGVMVGIHVGLAALIVCLLCLLLGWRHR
ncbi:immunoglobulin superfamily DCC subclass member 3-like [Equus quagga]|uniref:immunoglobulin superfamily DCC subclass member 3-like n=1 Tax=Equus quagga TaxID=89248 RepID=UPI001EE2A397|nr:immunoglobulin superfamily DCC subclass member 3-like [Equus quagga]